MSLQVWLPLNGDLHNQGLRGDILATNINALTFNSNGKIGKCYQRATTDSKVTTGIDLNTNFLDIFNTTASVAMWVKPLGSHTHYNGTLLSSGNWNAKRWAFGLNQNNTQVDVLCGGHNNYITCNVPINEWTHLCSTFDNGTCKLYKNGIYIGQLTGQKAFESDATNTCIGRETYASGYFGFNGLINDVRIYDHALSAKEVEEIAKGLVLHYKLDDIYSESTTNLCAGLVKGGRTNIVDNTVINTGENADTYWYIKPKEALVGGATYTVSCYLSGFTLDTDWIQWGVGAQSGDNNAGHWKTYNGYNSFTFIMPAGKDGSTANFIFDDSNPGTGRSQVFTISNVQLELKDHATPFIEYGQSRSADIIYDSSGYGNNGTIVGSLETTTPSPRYSCATHFTATTSKVLIENLNTSGFANSYSFIWWGKTNTFSNKMFWGFADGVRLNGIYNGNLWNTGDGANNPLYIPGTTTQVTAPSLNSWHHFAMIGNGTACVVYLDGELWGQAKTYKSISGTKIYMNGWDSGTSYTTNDMSISDFRIYATALTPAQIKELYNTSMSIDNNGNIHARELVEV